MVGTSNKSVPEMAIDIVAVGFDYSLNHQYGRKKGAPIFCPGAAENQGATVGISGCLETSPESQKYHGPLKMSSFIPYHPYQNC